MRLAMRFLLGFCIFTIISGQTIPQPAVVGEDINYPTLRISQFVKVDESVGVADDRVTLGIKQLQEDVFNEFTQINKKGSRVTGKVIEITDERIILSLSEEVQGYIPLKDYQNSSQEGEPSVGDEIESVVASIDKKDWGIILSLRALEKAEEREALKDNVERNKEIEEASKSNIGDMIKAELQDSEDE